MSQCTRFSILQSVLISEIPATLRLVQILSYESASMCCLLCFAYFAKLKSMHFVYPCSLGRRSTSQTSPPNVRMQSVCSPFMEERRYTTSTWLCSNSTIYSSSFGVPTSWQRWDRSRWRGRLLPITGPLRNRMISQHTLCSTLWDVLSGVQLENVFVWYENIYDIIIFMINTFFNILFL